jgi:hypothetical protein
LLNAEKPAKIGQFSILIPTKNWRALYIFQYLDGLLEAPDFVIPLLLPIVRHYG